MAKSPVVRAPKTTSAKRRAGNAATPSRPPKSVTAVVTPVKVVPAPVTEDPAPETEREALRKKEILDQVVLRSGVKRREAKPVVEAMLAIFGEALSDNRDIVAPPFGKMKVTRSKDLPAAQVLTCRVRRATTAAQTATKNPDDDAAI